MGLLDDTRANVAELACRLTDQQILILKEIKDNTWAPITKIVQRLSKEQSLPLSSLTWSYKRLKLLALIDCGNAQNKGATARLTKMGEEVVRLVYDEDEE